MNLIFLFLLRLGVSSQPLPDSLVGPNLACVQIHTSAVCAMCKETLEKAMAFERGVKDSKLNLNNMVLSVWYKPGKTSPALIRKAVSDVGYDADTLRANPRAYERLHECCKKEAHPGIK